MGPDFCLSLAWLMKEVYWEIKINKPGPRFLPELSLSGPAKVVYFDLPIYFLHGLTWLKNQNTLGRAAQRIVLEFIIVYQEY